MDVDEDTLRRIVREEIAAATQRDTSEIVMTSTGGESLAVPSFRDRVIFKDSRLLR